MKNKKLPILVLATVIAGAVFLVPHFSQASDCTVAQNSTECTECCSTQTPPQTPHWDETPGKCSCTSSSAGGTVTIGPPYGASGPQNINELIGNITTWVLGIAGGIAILFIILAGLRYITAHGASKQTEAAKTALTNAIIGLVIVVLSYTIVMIVIGVLTKK